MTNVPCSPAELQEAVKAFARCVERLGADLDELAALQPMGGQISSVTKLARTLRQALEEFAKET